MYLNEPLTDKPFYFRFLLAKYKAHINVEVIGGVGAIKYLFKYITKGQDMVSDSKKFGNVLKIKYIFLNRSWWTNQRGKMKSAST